MKNFTCLLLVIFLSVCLVNGNAFPIESVSTTAEVIAKAEALIIKQGQQLETLNRLQEATAVTEDVHELEKLVEKLRVAHAGTTVYMLEKQIQTVEAKLKTELEKAKASPTYYENGHNKEILLYRAQSLEKKTSDAIQQLKSQNKEDEVKVLVVDEASVKRMVAQLGAANSGTNLDSIEKELRAAELRLQQELKRLNLLPAYYENGHTREVLLFRAKSLEKRTSDAIQQLKSQNQANEVTVLEVDEANVKRMVAQLEAIHSGVDLDNIEKDLRAAELRLQQELKKLNPASPTRRDLKQDLIIRGNDLVRQARETIVNLQKVHNTHDIAIVSKEMANIEKLVKELESTTEMDLIRKFEHDLRLSELRMAFQLHRINHAKEGEQSHQDVLKQILLLRAATLKRMSTEAIEKFSQVQSNESEVAQLEKDLAQVKQLVAELEHSTSNLLEVEQKLTSAENQLVSQIRKVYLSLPQVNTDQ